MKIHPSITAAGVVLVVIVCTVDRSLSFLEKVSMLTMTVIWFRAFHSGEEPDVDRISVHDFFPAVLLSAVASVIGYLLGL